MSWVCEMPGRYNNSIQTTAATIASATIDQKIRNTTIRVDLDGVARPARRIVVPAPPETRRPTTFVRTMATNARTTTSTLSNLPFAFDTGASFDGPIVFASLISRYRPVGGRLQRRHRPAGSNQLLLGGLSDVSRDGFVVALTTDERLSVLEQLHIPAAPARDCST